jgi:WD40 repeat protein
MSSGEVSRDNGVPLGLEAPGRGAPGRRGIWRVAGIFGWLLAAGAGAAAFSFAQDAFETRRDLSSARLAASAARDATHREREGVVALKARESIRRGDAMSAIVTLQEVSKDDTAQSRVTAPSVVAALREAMIRNREVALLPLDVGSDTRAHISVDGRHAVTLDQKGSAELWPLTGPRPTKVALPQCVEVRCTDIRFHPDGSRVVLAMADGSVRLVKIADPAGSETLLQGQGSAVSAMEFSPDGRWLAVACEDSSLMMVDLRGGPPSIRRLTNQREAVRLIAFSGDRRFMAAAEGGGGGRIVIWDIRRQVPTSVEFLTEGFVASVAFGARGPGMTEHLMTVSRVGVHLESVVQFWWPTRPVGVGSFVTGDKRHSLEAAFSPDGRFILVTKFGGYAYVQEHGGVRSWSLGRQDPDEGVVLSRFLPDSRSAVTVSEAGVIRLWKWIEDEKSLDMFSGHTEGVKHAEVSGDGRRLLTAATDNTVRIWDLTRPIPGLTRLQVPEAPSVSEPRREHAGPASTFFVSPNQRWMIADTLPGETAPRLWDLKADPPTSQLLKSRSQIAFGGGSFSPDSKTFAIATSDGHLWLGRVADKGEPKLTPVADGPVYGLNSPHFSSNGQHLTTLTLSGAVIFWDLSGQPFAPKVVTRPAFSKDDVARAHALSPDGRTLAIVVMPGTPRGADAAPSELVVWDLEHDGGPTLVARHTVGRVSRVALTNDRRTAILADDRGQVFVVDTAAERIDLTHPLPRLVTDRLSNPEAPTKLVVSPNSRWLVAFSYGRTPLLFDLQHRERSFPLDGHTATVNGAAFDDSGMRVATASDDGSVRLWELSNSEEPVSTSVDLRAGPLGHVGFVESPVSLITGSLDGGAALWRLTEFADLLRAAETVRTRQSP